MGRSFKLLPLTILMAFLLLGLKVGEVMRDGQQVALSFTEARAEESKDAVKPADKKEDAASGEPKVNPPSMDNDDASQEEQPPKHEYSQVEIDLLQSLAKRRSELDDWAKQVQLKENMLIATEQRINGKIDSLQNVKKQVEDLLAQYNEQEDTKIKSLVKIYENMKPKDAARIFEELDMPVLLMVVDRMNDRKVAPVLAAMSPTKAKDVTVQLAEQRKLQKNRPGANVSTPTHRRHRLGRTGLFRLACTVTGFGGCDVPRYQRRKCIPGRFRRRIRRKPRCGYGFRRRSFFLCSRCLTPRHSPARPCANQSLTFG